MSVRERFVTDEGGADAAMVIIDDPDFKSNPTKTHGIWSLFVSEAASEEVIEGLRLSVERKQFTAVMTDKTIVKPEGSMILVCVFHEGALYRRHLWESLRTFDKIGVDGNWIYCDLGANRHKAPRRLLLGNRVLGSVTEIDYRREGVKPIVRHFVPTR